jgi:hypothetical protein
VRTCDGYLEATRTISIVFPLAADPVGAGWIESLPRPGGNATGFATQDYRFGGKWLELLKEIAPGITRAAVIRDAAISVGLCTKTALEQAAEYWFALAELVKQREKEQPGRTALHLPVPAEAHTDSRVLAHGHHGNSVQVGPAIEGAFEADALAYLTSVYKDPPREGDRGHGRKSNKS